MSKLEPPVEARSRARESRAADGPSTIVVMGVSGVGKSKIGAALATRLQLACADGDDFHTVESKAKMAAGQALSDEDRWPWLARVGAWLAQHRADGAVVSCSALKRAYRDRLRDAAPRLVCVHLTGDPALIAQRIQARSNHFMPASLLQSQLDTLEPLAADESGLVLDVTGRSPDELVESIVTLLSGAR